MTSLRNIRERKEVRVARARISFRVLEHQQDSSGKIRGGLSVKQGNARLSERFSFSEGSRDQRRLTNPEGRDREEKKPTPDDCQSRKVWCTR